MGIQQVRVIREKNTAYYEEHYVVLEKIFILKGVIIMAKIKAIAAILGGIALGGFGAYQFFKKNDNEDEDYDNYDGSEECEDEAVEDEAE